METTDREVSGGMQNTDGVWKIYIPLTVQNELAREQFIQAITPRELSIQTQQAHPCILHEALWLALEREIVGAGPTESGMKEDPGGLQTGS